jgi:hypothetical protein
VENAKLWVADFFQLLLHPNPGTVASVAVHSREKSGIVLAQVSVFGAFSILILFVTLRIPLSFGVVVTSVFFSPLVYILWVFVIHLSYQKLFHRKKSCHEALFYGLSFGFVACLILDALLMLVPFIKDFALWIGAGCLIVLSAITIRGIVRLKAWQSVIVAGSGLVVASVLAYLVIIFILILATNLQYMF